MKLCVVLGIFTLVSASAAELRDPKAVEIAGKMIAAMGGEEAWAKARYIRFDFRFLDGGSPKMERSHLWDKSTGRYRLDSKNTVTLMNLATQKGDALAEGKKLEGEAAAKALKDAYAAYINDYYWLAMPWKWTEPGVNLKYLGKKPCGKTATCDVVELTFGKVGLTPGDRYHAFVNPQTNLMEHWEYTLQNGTKGAWDWEYTTTGGVKLASNHTDGKGKALHMGNVKVLDKVDAGVFDDPKIKF
jgi:hypothetical protein